MENRAWFLFTKKLTGEATDAESRELNHLLSAQPELHQELQALEALWQGQLQASDSAAAQTEADFDKLVLKMQQQGIDFSIQETASQTQTSTTAVKLRWLKKPITWVSTAAAAAVLVAAMWWMPGTEAKQMEEPALAKANQVSTRPGSRSKVVLPDGTQVWLNADSKLTYGNDFGVSSRDVTLSGEAYFDVKPNKEVPFYIHTSKINIKVTGTVFNVRAYPNETRSETSLLHGKVEVTLNSSPDKTYYLKPSDKLVVTDDGGINQTSAAMAGSALQKQNRVATVVQIPVMQKLVVKPDELFPVETAWVNNTLAFNDESFREVADKMERWYGVEIVFAHHELEQMRFTGRFENETVAQALEAMQLATPFHFSMKGNSILISKSTK